LSESGFPGFKDFQDVKNINLSESGYPGFKDFQDVENINLSESGFSGFEDFQDVKNNRLERYQNTLSYFFISLYQLNITIKSSYEPRK
jgi:hypothetical protein